MAEPPPEFTKAAQQAEPPPADPGASFTAAETEAAAATRELQERLRATGFFSGEADGVYGPSTADAVRRFQASVGLPADGLAGPQTLERLDRLAEGVPDPGGGEPAQTAAPAAPDASAAPVAALLHSKADTGAARRIAAVIAGEAGRGAVTTVAVEETRGLPPGDLELPSLVVPCLSRPFLSAGRELAADLLGRAERGELRVAPLLLEPVELGGTPFGTFQALAGAEPLATAPSPDAWLQAVAEEVRRLARPTPRSYLPRFSADSLEGKDLLERRGKIEFLASVLAAKQLETPLAIGLFGDWGSGKSFFMRRLQETIVDLTEASAAAVKAGDESFYCSHIRHVNFNAWLHSGAPDLWPAFAAEVFRGVSDPETRDEQGRTQRSDLIGFRRQVAEAEERKERIRELEAEIEKRSGELHGNEPDAGAATKLVGTIRETAARLAGLRHGWRDLRAGDVLLLVAIGIAAAAFAVFETPLAWAAAGATALLSVLRYLDEARRLHRLEEELAEKQAEQAAYDRGAAVAVPPELLPDFARKEAADWAQRAQFDSVTEIRMKFDRLSELIAQGLGAQAGPGGEATDAVPIERVIVYVDDLDRCQHEVVIGVLETLKLLLSLPHFVAVVGVDSRWLFRSLELHFRDLLHADGEPSEDAAWAATPQNYLEKIFQYSIVLQPISETGFATLIQSLLAPPAGPSPGAVPGPGPEPPDGVSPPAAPPAGDVQPPGAPAPPETLRPDLTPAELVITPAEIEFIAGLASMFETPRAAKRLANVYRLMRVSVGVDALLRDEDYEPALLLLAIGIGFPGLAGDVFAEIKRSPETTWPAFVKGLATDDEARRKLKDRLGRASPGHVADRTLASFGPWIPVVAEFSFHPWQELLEATAQS